MTLSGLGNAAQTESTSEAIDNFILQNPVFIYWHEDSDGQPEFMAIADSHVLWSGIYVYDEGIELGIDGANSQNPLKLMNHWEDGNAQSLPMLAGQWHGNSNGDIYALKGQYSPDDLIIPIVARKDIIKGEELVFCYRQRESISFARVGDDIFRRPHHYARVENDHVTFFPDGDAIQDSGSNTSDEPDLEPDVPELGMEVECADYREPISFMDAQMDVDAPFPDELEAIKENWLAGDENAHQLLYQRLEEPETQVQAIRFLVFYACTELMWDPRTVGQQLNRIGVMNNGKKVTTEDVRQFARKAFPADKQDLILKPAVKAFTPMRIAELMQDAVDNPDQGKQLISDYLCFILGLHPYKKGERHSAVLNRIANQLNRYPGLLGKDKGFKWTISHVYGLMVELELLTEFDQVRLVPFLWFADKVNSPNEATRVRARYILTQRMELCLDEGIGRSLPGHLTQCKVPNLQRPDESRWFMSDVYSYTGRDVEEVDEAGKAGLKASINWEEMTEWAFNHDVNDHDQLKAIVKSVGYETGCACVTIAAMKSGKTLDETSVRLNELKLAAGRLSKPKLLRWMFAEMTKEEAREVFGSPVSFVSENFRQLQSTNQPLELDETDYKALLKEIGDVFKSDGSSMRFSKQWLSALKDFPEQKQLEKVYLEGFLQNLKINKIQDSLAKNKIHFVMPPRKPSGDRTTLILQRCRELDLYDVRLLEGGHLAVMMAAKLPKDPTLYKMKIGNDTLREVVLKEYSDNKIPEKWQKPLRDKGLLPSLEPVVKKVAKTKR